MRGGNGGTSPSQARFLHRTAPLESHARPLISRITLGYHYSHASYLSRTRARLSILYSQSPIPLLLYVPTRPIQTCLYNSSRVQSLPSSSLKPAQGPPPIFAVDVLIGWVRTRLPASYHPRDRYAHIPRTAAYLTSTFSLPTWQCC